MNYYYTDKELALKISNGDSLSWNHFIDKYSDYILSNIILWCNKTCRVFNSDKECVVQSIKSGNSNSNSNACDEGLELYIYIFSALKEKITKFQGKSSLKTYITACLRYIYNDYFISKYGKINIPVALKDLSDQEKKIYKILCRSKNIEDALDRSEKVNISNEDFHKSYEKIVNLLKDEGKEKLWQHLYSNFSKNSGLERIDKDNTDGSSEILIPVSEVDLSLKEVIKIFSTSYKNLDSISKRLLKLKFKDNMSTKDIFNKYSDLFNLSKEQDVYNKIDNAIKVLLNNIREKYQDEYKNESKSDIKDFKDSLYDIFQLVEV